MKWLYICLGTRLSEMVEVGNREGLDLAMMMGYMDGHRYHDFTVRVSSRIEPGISGESTTTLYSV